jgi:hypothetical protein
MPNEPAAASTFITAAVSGTKRLRNAMRRRMNERPTTTPMNKAILRLTTVAKSTLMAVPPDT